MSISTMPAVSSAPTGIKRYISEWWKQKELWILLMPTLVLLFLFCYRPMYGVMLAFKKYNIELGILHSPWVGNQFFMRLFNSDIFWRVIQNTLIISVLKIAIVFPAPILFTLLINEVSFPRFKKISQTISYLPHFLSWVVVSALMTELLSNNGTVNDLVELLGGKRNNWLTSSAWFVPLLLLSSLWKELGWSSIVYLAAINGIDPTLYEAAAIDGCSRFKMMRRITIPCLLPTISVMFLLRIGGIMNAGFDQIYNLYNPLVFDVGDIIDTYSYRLGMNSLDYSMSTAIGLFKNVIGLMLMLTVNFSINRKNNGYGII